MVHVAAVIPFCSIQAEDIVINFFIQSIDLIA